MVIPIGSTYFVFQKKKSTKVVQPNLAASLKSWEPPIPSPIPHPNPPAESICMKKERHLDLAVLDERS